jgi:AcrR family transcriptional regulator
MAGLRELKRRRMYQLIHETAMELFARRGYASVTVGDIAEAAEVSRATVFTYYPTKEDIVAGDAPMAIASLRAALAPNPEASSVLDAVRAWLRTLIGWIEPDVLLQRRLADEVPGVAAVRSRVMRDIGAVIAEALTEEAEEAEDVGAVLTPRLIAGALVAALEVVEQEAARRMAETGHGLGDEEVDRLLDLAVAFVDGGKSALAGNPDLL